jgi:hypothetical protein
MADKTEFEKQMEEQRARQPYSTWTIDGPDPSITFHLSLGQTEEDARTCDVPRGYEVCWDKIQTSSGIGHAGYSMYAPLRIKLEVWPEGKPGLGIGEPFAVWHGQQGNPHPAGEGCTSEQRAEVEQRLLAVGWKANWGQAISMTMDTEYIPLAPADPKAPDPKFDLEWIVEGHPRFERNRHQPPLVMVHVAGEDHSKLSLSVMNLSEADASVVEVVERGMPSMYEIDPSTTCTRVPGGWTFALRRKDAAPPPVGPTPTDVNSIAIGYQAGLSGDMHLCQALVDRMFGEGTFFVRQWAKDDKWYCSVTDNEWSDTKATVTNPTRRGAELMMLGGLCEALKVMLLREMHQTARDIVADRSVKQAIEDLKRSKAAPDTVCANCGEPFSPPVGLFGTNDCECPHCTSCYAAVSKEEFAKRGQPS